MMGKPCIRGTRITVELILRKLGAGRSFADLVAAYPNLTEDERKLIQGDSGKWRAYEHYLPALSEAGVPLARRVFGNFKRGSYVVLDTSDIDVLVLAFGERGQLTRALERTEAVLER